MVAHDPLQQEGQLRKFWVGIVDLVRGMVGHSLVQPWAGAGITLMFPLLALSIYGLFDPSVKFWLKDNEWAQALFMLAMFPAYFFTGGMWMTLARRCSQSEDNWLLNFLEPYHRNKLLYDAAEERRFRESIRASRQKEDRDQG